MRADRAQFFNDPTGRSTASIGPGRKCPRAYEKLVATRHDGGLKATYDCIKAFSETDFTEDLKKIDVPTLIIHGDDDQIVPIGASALISSKLVKGAKLKVYGGAPHGLLTTLKDQINQDLLAFIKGEGSRT